MHIPHPTSALRLLITDDHQLFREGLRALLRERSPWELADAVYGAAVALASRFTPDVVIFGMGSEASEGIRWVRRLLRRLPAVGLLVLDERIRPVNLSQLLHLGVRGYWTKNASATELVEAVERVERGETSFATAVARRVVVTPAGPRYQPETNDRSLGQLSQREMEVLLHLAGGMSVKQCAVQMNLASSTIENHKARMMRKLGVHKTVELTRIAMRAGLLD